MGIIVQGKGLWKALFTRTQRRLLGLLYGYPDRSFYANEIVRLAGVGTGSVQRELRNLATAGVLSVTRVGNQKHYQANRDCPFYPELRSIVIKTFGALDLLRTTVRDLEGTVFSAFIHGHDLSEPAGNGTPLKLFLMSDDIKRARAESKLEEVCKRLGRDLQLVILSRERYDSLLMGRHGPLFELLEEPRIMLAGTFPPE